MYWTFSRKNVYKTLNLNCESSAGLKFKVIFNFLFMPFISYTNASLIFSRSNKNVSMWINNILLLVRPIASTWIMGRPIASTRIMGRPIASTRIMGRPMISCKTIKVIGSAPPGCTQEEQRSIGSVRRKLRRRRRKWYAWVNHEFNYLTVDVTFLPINQAAISRMTHQPVVYVALDENLSAELFPEWEVYGVVVCFIWWRSCGDRNIHFGSHRPIWPRSDCIWFARKMTIISEGIAPQCPASSISLHVTVSLESVGLGSTIRINLINARDQSRIFTEESLTRVSCWMLGWTRAQGNALTYRVTDVSERR